MAKKAFDFQAVMFAAGGGVAAEAVMTMAESKIKFFQDKPNLVPVLPMALGAAGMYFMKDDKMKPLFYGMTAVGAANLAGGLMSKIGGGSDNMDGFNRINYLNGGRGLSDMVEDMTEQEAALAEYLETEDELGE